MINYLHRHYEVAKDALKRIMQSPGSTLVSAAIIGVAIALPLLMFKMTENISKVTSDWQTSDVITVYLTPTLTDSDAGIELAQGILRIPQVNDVQFIASDQVFDEFRDQSGIAPLLDELDSGLLPAIVYVYPEASLIDAELSGLVSTIELMEGVDQVTFDRQWQNRLQAIIELFEFGVLVLSGLMALGVILIISNTVRLGILDRRDEIQIIDQVGGTGSFVRRPFLYFGVYQGVLGAITALVISTILLALLASPVDKLAQLYNSQFEIHQLTVITWIMVVLLSAVLGWIAARLTAGGYIRKMRASVRGK